MHELMMIGFICFVLAMYVNDLGVAVMKFMALMFNIQSELAALLGLVFKPSKDELNVREIKYIGFMLKMDGNVVLVRVPLEYCEVVTNLIITKVQDSDCITVENLESLLGKM